MSDTPKLYCKVYLDAEAEKGQLLDLVASITAGSIKMRTVSSPVLQADLVANEDFDETKRCEGKDQFLFYRYYLDIEPEVACDPQD